MPYKRRLRNAIIWMASFYVPADMLPEAVRKPGKSKQRVFEAAEKCGYPNTEKGAAQLENRRKREIAEGTYVYEVTGEHTAATWVVEWTEKRATRYKHGERRRVENHFLTFRDFKIKKLSAFRPSDFKAFAQHGREIVAAGRMSSKNFMNVWGVVHTMFHDAVAAERIAVNPVVVSRGDLPMRRAKRGRKYDDAEMRQLVWNEELPADLRVLFCLLAFTGERIGEACGHVWSDWDPGSTPLGALILERQYNGRPLKSSTDKERPRVVPVHPELAKALDWWKREGWAAFYGRSPRPGDPIIPNAFKKGHHTEKSIYHHARDAFKAAGLPWKAHHACRHAFTTTARRLGASEFWTERITHNAGGSTVDHYTHTEWDPLCAVVQVLPWRLEGAQVIRLAASDVATRVATDSTEQQKTSRFVEREKGFELPTSAGTYREIPGKSAGKLEKRRAHFPDESGAREALAPPVAKQGAEGDLQIAVIEHRARVEAGSVRGKRGGAR